ncbi:unnamed protein product [Psylliodes chrysocephalus]|uniref:Uncharacterized protein n=1 Tax=Psylliodes chrysocephalus TaxID=3402493 RepID=A0A9P0CPR6_9CUCU|nr:unnamed protein product [Psylliodes chrysocephala]
MGHELQPTDWGWEEKENDSLEPIRILGPPAPDKLLRTIFCSCKKACSKKYPFEESGNDYTISTGIPSAINKSSDIAEPKFEKKLKIKVLLKRDQNKQVENEVDTLGNYWLAAEGENTTADKDPYFEQFCIPVDKDNTSSKNSYIPCAVKSTDISEAKIERNLRET